MTTAQPSATVNIFSSKHVVFIDVVVDHTKIEFLFLSTYAVNSRINLAMRCQPRSSVVIYHGVTSFRGLSRVLRVPSAVFHSEEVIHAQVTDQVTMILPPEKFPLH